MTDKPHTALHQYRWLVKLCLQEFNMRPHLCQLGGHMDIHSRQLNGWPWMFKYHYTNEWNMQLSGQFSHSVSYLCTAKSTPQESPVTMLLLILWDLLHLEFALHVFPHEPSNVSKSIRGECISRNWNVLSAGCDGIRCLFFSMQKQNDFCPWLLLDVKLLDLSTVQLTSTLLNMCVIYT